ncbi:hypothetical protein H9Q13_04910 [Pontibacter sp. JH31]|uniref:Uncharacterized protein n=1 Tax=Pontibacter aquaedesilientis TaxID=2766980 RepID=A0ABR7XEZ9_9BACT|nr:hypothetical protein [Pontibacter aquaedesilientis]MBD1396496.1 hypothetical protein [Pontibacter aquaedesilientis]
MKDFERIKNALNHSNILVLKNEEKKVECSFIKEGLVYDNFEIENRALASALQEKSTNGIVEGFNFERLKNTYDWFTLHVKSRMVLEALK